MDYPARALWAAFLLALLLAGCGQKGPLYRPDQAPEPEGQEAPAGDGNAPSSSDRASG